MIKLRKAGDRGHADHGWLRTWHTFSFADYYDPAEMGWGPLRVINEDFIAPGTGFGMHGHRDMEIVTYMLEGPLTHRDSMKNGAVISPGEIQHMSAGTGVLHSEHNASATDTAHLLQIWIEPAVRGIAPEYQQKAFDPAERRGRLRLVVSPDGADGSLPIHQDACLYDALLAPGETVSHAPAAGRRAYLHVVRGAVDLNDRPMATGDGAKIADEPALFVRASADAEILLFDLP